MAPRLRLPAVCAAWMLLLAGHVAALAHGLWDSEAPYRALSLATGVVAALLWTARGGARAPGAFRRTIGTVCATASLLAAGASLGIEASRSTVPAEVHPTGQRVVLEGFVADAASAAEAWPTLPFDVHRGRIGDRDVDLHARVLARWPAGLPPATWATAGTALRLEGTVRPPEDSRNPGGGSPRRRYARAGIVATLDVDPGGVAAWSPPRDGSVLRRSPWRPLLAEARRAIADRFEAVAGPRAAALARGMLLGDRGGIEPEMRTSFRNAGTLHILSISGLHVCIIAGFLAAAARAARLGAAGSMAMELAGLALYVIFVGAPPPALRSALLWTLSRGSRLLGRGSSALAGWGAAGLVLHLAWPALTMDLGFALSFGAVLGLHAGAAVAPLPMPAEGASRGRRALGALVAAMAAGAGASIGTLPVEAAAFGSIPVMGPVANLAVIPLTGLFLAESILVAATAWIAPAPVAALLGGALDALAVVLTTVNDALGGRVEPVALHVVPPVAAAALSWAALLAAASLGSGRVPRTGHARRLLAGSLLVVAALAPLVPLRASARAGNGPASPVALLVLDVGQGDGALLLGERGAAVLVDAGPRGEFRDEGRLTIEPALRVHGVRRVVAAISSHGHRDHEGGFRWLARRGWLRDVVENGGGTPDRDAWRAAVSGAGGRLLRPRAEGVRVAAGGWTARVEGPLAGGEQAQGAVSANTAENDRSLVALARAGPSGATGAGAAPWTALFPGDLERAGEAAWLTSPAVTAADVLKVPHHGSSTSSTPEWVARVRPRLAVISVGARNRYGHPATATLSRYRRAGSWVARTDQEGAIRITQRDGRVWISTRSHPAPRPLPGRSGAPITPCFDFP